MNRILLTLLTASLAACSSAPVKFNEPRTMTIKVHKHPKPEPFQQTEGSSVYFDEQGNRKTGDCWLDDTGFHCLETGRD